MHEDDRADHWHSFPPRIISPSDPDYEFISDWRTVDLESLPPMDRKLMEKFRDRARELGLDLENAPEAATDMYKPPYTEQK